MFEYKEHQNLAEIEEYTNEQNEQIISVIDNKRIITQIVELNESEETIAPEFL